MAIIRIAAANRTHTHTKSAVRKMRFSSVIKANEQQ